MPDDDSENSSQVTRESDESSYTYETEVSASELIDRSEDMLRNTQQNAEVEQAIEITNLPEFLPTDEEVSRSGGDVNASRAADEDSVSRSSSEDDDSVSVGSSSASSSLSSFSSTGTIESEGSDISDDGQDLTLEQAIQQSEEREREARQPGPDVGNYNHTEIGNLSQYLAMKEFHGHNISDEMLDHFMKAQNVIDKTRSELGHPANITRTNGELSGGEISFGELIESNADMAVVKHHRDIKDGMDKQDEEKLSSMNPKTKMARDVIEKAALATVYEQGNCVENASKGMINTTIKFTDDKTMSIRRKAGEYSDHGWVGTSFKTQEPTESKDYEGQDIKGDDENNSKIKKSRQKERTIIDPWSDLQAPIFKQDMHENYSKSKTTAKFKEGKEMLVKAYDKKEQKIRDDNPNAIQEKENVLAEVTPKYRAGLRITDEQLSMGINQLDAGVKEKELTGQAKEDYIQRTKTKNTLQKGLYQPGGTHIISKEFDDKTLANEIYNSQKFEKNQQGPFSERAQSTRDEAITADDYIEGSQQPRGANMRDHSDLMQQEFQKEWVRGKMKR